MDLPVLLHIPHSSAYIPPEEMPSYLISARDLADQNLKLTDLYTDELYTLEGAKRAVFPVSRFFTDAERFSDDSQESMAGRGMGVLYTVTTDLKPLRALPVMEKRQEIMDEHIKVGNKYPSVKLNTTYSFGLDDQDFVVAFESDEPKDFLDLVMELRETESSRFTQRDTPIFTCIQMPMERILDQLF